jgi:Flp pilus assembly protein TadG
MRAFLQRLAGDESGATAVFTALFLVIALGFVGLGVDTGVAYNARREAQNAADSAAFSAAVGKAAGAGNVADQARAVAARYGLVHGVGGVSVTVNTPPTAGTHIDAQAVEVIIARPGRRYFSRFFDADALTIHARAVAVAGASGDGCVVAFNPSAPLTILDNGNSNVNLVGCSLYDNSANDNGLFLNGSAKLHANEIFLAGDYGQNGNSSVTTDQGIHSHQPPLGDPYGNVGKPSYSGCNGGTGTVINGGAVTIANGGVKVFCNGLTLNGNGTVHFDPGVYVIDRGAFTVNGGMTVTGAGVTFFLTSSTGSGYATTTFNGNGTSHLSAPTSGDYAGLLFYQDRRAPAGGNNVFNGTSSNTFTGALYFPKQQATFNGNSSVANGGCTQLLADKITFNGSNTLEVNCAGTGVRGIGGHATQLVE